MKGLWDADRAEGLNLHIVLLGSSPLLMQKGMKESLTGRYELIRINHWSFLEMHEAFDFDLEMLGNAGLIVGLQKYYHGQQLRRRASPPKFNVLNNALMTADSGYTKAEAKADRTYWGRIVESAVGQHLYNSGHPDCRLHYWRESSHEVDFVIERGNKISVVEVKSGAASGYIKGFDKFEEKFGHCRKLLVSDNSIPLVEFLSYPTEHWL